MDLDKDRAVDVSGPLTPSVAGVDVSDGSLPSIGAPKARARLPLRAAGVRASNNAVLNETGNKSSKKRKLRECPDDHGDVINLEGSISRSVDDVTFEFQDTSENHVEGLTVLLRTIIKNPTTAFEFASIIATAGKNGDSLLWCVCTEVKLLVDAQYQLARQSHAMVGLTLSQ
jgi:hypothetical protein